LKGSWLTCYWITTGERWGPLGFGVTAFSVEDAIKLIRSEGFDISETLERLQIRENVTFAELDRNHVVLNMGPMIMRGVWYPRRNLYKPLV
jgi:hypothetical protein